MKSSKTDKSTLCQCILIGPVKERQKDHFAVLRLDRCYPLIRDIVDRSSLCFCFLFFIAHQISDEPFHVSRRCRTALFNKKISRHTEHRIQIYRAVCHRLFPDKFVDAPGSGDHAHLLLIRKSGGDSAGVHIKHAGRHRGSFLKACLLSRFFCHGSAYFSGIFERRQLLITLLKSEKFHQLSVMFSCIHIDQVSARAIRIFTVGNSGQAITDVVFYRKNILCLLQYLGHILFKPFEQGYRLYRQNFLAGLLIHLLIGAVLIPLFYLRPCSGICGHNTVVGRFSVKSDHIQSLARTGKGDTYDICRVDSAFLKGSPYCLRINIPEFIQIFLCIAGLRCKGYGRNTCHRDLCSGLIEDCCFGEGSSIVNSQ